MVSLILRPTALKRAPLIGALFKAAFTGDLGQRIERLNEAMGLLAGACQGLGFRRLTVSSGEWLGLLGVLLGQPMAKVLPMRGQFLAEAVASSQMIFAGKRVEMDTGSGTRFGTIFGVKSYPARTWARMLDALELPYDIVITNSFTPAHSTSVGPELRPPRGTAPGDGRSVQNAVALGRDDHCPADGHLKSLPLQFPRQG